MTAPVTNPLYQSDIPGLPAVRGKVRDVYDLGEQLLIVATDRLSAFDVVFPDPIPDKGAVLTRLSEWWFRRTRSLAPSHFVTADFDAFPERLQPYRDQLAGRSMLVQRCRPLRGEFVVRGYLDGSAYKAYEFNKHVSGIDLLAGLRQRSSFGAPIFTPTTKAEEGHDMPVDFSGLVNLVGEHEAATGREYSLALYTYAHNYLYGRGLILSDTKFEFGQTNDGRIILIDEALTPDSSRFWLKETYTPDSEKPISLDKQYVRDHVEKSGWNKQPPAPRLPAGVIAQTSERYRKAFEMITGEPFARA